MDTIEMLVAKGRASLAEQAKLVEEERAKEISDKRDAWRLLEEAVRLAFPEEVRGYVQLDEAHVEDPRAWPMGEKFYPAIIVPGFAPIYTCVGASNKETWELTKHTFRWGRGPFYRVPQWTLEEYGWHWDLNYGGKDTDSLEEALAFAETLGKEKQEQIARSAAAQNVTPVYEPMEEVREVGGSVINMDELIALVRGVVDEQLARQAE